MTEDKKPEHSGPVYMPGEEPEYGTGPGQRRPPRGNPMPWREQPQQQPEKGDQK